MRKLRLLNSHELEQAYSEVFTEAFPPAELKPLWAITEMLDEGIYFPYGLFEESTPLGYICLWEDGEYMLIDYLCVPKGSRNGGIGAEIIRRTIDAFPDNTVFIGEVEAPTGVPENDIIINRRLGFYDRCGAMVMDYDTALFGVHYKTIVWSKQAPNSSEVLRHHQNIYRHRFTAENYAASVQIPLHDGEQPHPLTAWSE